MYMDKFINNSGAMIKPRKKQIMITINEKQPEGLPASS